MASQNTLKLRGVPPAKAGAECIITIRLNPLTGQSVLNVSGTPINHFGLIGVLMSQSQGILEQVAKASMGIIDPNKKTLVSTENPEPEQPETPFEHHPA